MAPGRRQPGGRSHRDPWWVELERILLVLLDIVDELLRSRG